MSEKGAIWVEFQRVLTWWETEANRNDIGHKRVLHDGALAYADSVRAATRAEHGQPTGVADHSDEVLVLPFSRSRGRTPADAETADLQWILPILKESLDDPTKAKFRAKNERLVEQIRDELETR